MSFRGSRRQRQDDSFLGAIFGILIGFSDWFCNSCNSVQSDSDEHQSVDDCSDNELSYEEISELEDMDMF